MSVLHRFGLQGGGTVEPWHGLGSWTSWMCWVLCTLQNRALHGHGDTLMLQTVKYTLRNGLDAAQFSGRARRQSSPAHKQLSHDVCSISSSFCHAVIHGYSLVAALQSFAFLVQNSHGGPQYDHPYILQLLCRSLASHAQGRKGSGQPAGNLVHQPGQGWQAQQAELESAQHAQPALCSV